MKKIIFKAEQAKILLPPCDKTQPRASYKNIGSNFILKDKKFNFALKTGWRALMADNPMASFPTGGTFWTKSELFLTKIRTATFNCRPQGGNPAQRFRPPSLCFGEQNRKIFLTFFNRPLAKFFSIKETKIFLFWYSANAELRKRFPPHSPPLADWQAGKNSFSPHPFFFLPACLGFALNFFGGKLFMDS